MYELTGYEINLAIVGFLIVFAVLATISIVVGVLQRVDSKGVLREESRKEAALKKQPTIDETTLVLISAAVATVLQGRFAIRSIRRVTPGERGTPWSMQGRGILHGSHVVPKKTST